MSSKIDTVLIDADILVYRAGFATNTDPESYAKQALRYQVNSILAVFPGAKSKLILSPTEGNFREKIAVSRKYKGNRKQPRPIHYEALRRFIQNTYACQVAEGMEGDDLLGILQTDTSVICSIDKDMLMVPGNHYNFVNKEHIIISKTVAWRNFCSQLLTGDSADNIPGCPGIGPITAKGILQPEPGARRMGESVPRPRSKQWMWDQVVKTYQWKYPVNWREVLEEQAILLWIRRDENEPFDIRRLMDE